jgi:GTPase SAR1 family protein
LSDYLNILILGETGVGKSTFINALVNYLEFETLDDALDANNLKWMVPCHFLTEIMNRSNPDQEIEVKLIQVGPRSDENDGSKFDSATQQTTVYPITVFSELKTYTIRLIDTPGIGDPQGVEYDKMNMADALTTVSSYDKLDGILILFKPNSARLTITFQYCLKELLTHLPHGAAQNMIFGFTNTRSSNYTPGDTFNPLKRLLGQNRNVGLTLSMNTKYCFDSESFRYLAASKSGVEMPDKEDFDRSWRQSRDETLRMITYLKSVLPHETKNTMTLNRARRKFLELIKPMAEISQLIQTNIAICEDKRAELRDIRPTGDQLRKFLLVQKIQLEAEALAQPRTVCTNHQCTEIRGDGTGGMRTIYKTHCHSSCHLAGVSPNQIAATRLKNCAAFDGTGHCRNCSHRWQEHMNVMDELKEHAVVVMDRSVEQQLEAHADDITLRQEAISNLDQRVKEYVQEYDAIRLAAAKLGLFLQNNSITAYNDATIAYLDLLVEAETDKVQSGGNNAKLLVLKEELQRHKETVRILTRSMNANANTVDLSEAGVERIMQQLYDLKHFGKNFRSLEHSRGIPLFLILILAIDSTSF